MNSKKRAAWFFLSAALSLHCTVGPACSQDEVITPPSEWMWIPSWSPDGKLIAASWPAPKKVLLDEKPSGDAELNRPVFIPTPPSVGVHRSPRFGVVSDDIERRTVLIRSDNFKRLPVIFEANLIRSVWSPDGQMIAGQAFPSSAVVVCEISTGKVVKVLSKDLHAIRDGLAWSADSKMLISANSSSVEVFEVSTWRKLFAIPELKGTLDSTVAFAPNGSMIAASGTKDDSYKVTCLKICKATDGKTMLSKEVKDEVGGLGWSSDGRWFAYSDKSLHIVSGTTLEEKINIPTSTRKSLRFHWSPDGTKIGFIGSDGILHIYDLAHETNVVTIAAEKTGMCDFEWSPDSTLVAVNDHDKLGVFRIADGCCLGAKEFGDIPVVQWSADGKALALSAFSAECVYWVPVDLKAKPVLKDGMVSNPWQNQLELKTLEDCFAALDQLLSDAEKEKMKNCIEPDLCLYTGGPGLAMQLRNMWGLRKENALTEYFHSKGITDGADMSTYIIESYWRHLNNYKITDFKQRKNHFRLGPPIKVNNLFAPRNKY